MVRKNKDDQKFCSLEDNDQKVILVKTGNSAPSVPTPTGRGQPSNFPTPPAGGRPSRNVPGVNPYRVAPKIVPGPFQVHSRSIPGTFQVQDWVQQLIRLAQAVEV